MMSITMINVTCAVILNEENQILVVQKGGGTDHPYKWEFPGGKLYPGESEEDCIVREIKEELSIDIIICGRLPAVKHDYGHKKIKLIPFVCDTLDELPLLTEHIAFSWVDNTRLKSIDFSEADIYVAENYLSSSFVTGNTEKGRSSESQLSSELDADLQRMVNNMMGMKEAEWVATSAIENPAIFSKLLEYSFSPDKKLAFRASWTLTKVCDKFPDLIYPYMPEIIESLDKIDNESALRSFLRIISLSELDKVSDKHHGILAEHCFASLKSGFSAIAIKAYAMEILYNLVLKYPELHNELAATITILIEDLSGGVKARGRMILKKLAQIPIALKSSHQ